MTSFHYVWSASTALHCSQLSSLLNYALGFLPMRVFLSFELPERPPLAGEIGLRVGGKNQVQSFPSFSRKTHPSTQAYQCSQQFSRVLTLTVHIGETPGAQFWWTPARWALPQGLVVIGGWQFNEIAHSCLLVQSPLRVCFFDDQCCVMSFLYLHSFIL